MVAYILAISSVSIVAPIASILLINSFLAWIASGEREYLVIPPCPASPNLLKVLILSSILFTSQVYINSPPFVLKSASYRILYKNLCAPVLYHIWAYCRANRAKYTKYFIPIDPDFILFWILITLFQDKYNRICIDYS